MVMEAIKSGLRVAEVYSCALGGHQTKSTEDLKRRNALTSSLGSLQSITLSRYEFCRAASAIAAI